KGGPHRQARIGELAWGAPGLGMVVEGNDYHAVVVHTDAGDHVAVIPGQPAFLGGLRWQPRGSLLAFVTVSLTVVSGQGSVMRAIDATTGRVRVLAADAQGLAGTVWAPDGRLLATLSSRGQWLFVDPTGHRVSQVDVTN